MTITQVQAPKRGIATSSSTLTLTLNNTPASGNILVAVIGTFGSYPPLVSSIAQQSGNVTWTQQKYSSQYNIYGRRVEIWTGIVSGTVSPTLTITLAASQGGSSALADPVIANVAEYSGLDTTSLLDTSATSTGTYTTTLTTGTTPTTSQADELWIGGLFYVTNLASGGTITAPTNSFTLYDGTSHGSSVTTSLAYLERIVSATGTAYSGATGASGATYSAYVGCIVALKGSDFVADVIVTDNLVVTDTARVGTLIAQSSVSPDLSPTWNGSEWVNGRSLGSASQFWNYIDCAYYFAKHTAFIAFDSLDDLGLVKNYKTKQEDNLSLIDFDSLPHLKSDDPRRVDSIDIGKTAGFMLGCIKALTQRIEAIENQLPKKQTTEEETT
jgi:hypothetical protein